MKISLLYFDDCPNWALGLQRLKQALEESGLGGEEIELVEIVTEADAERERFPGSPTFRVGGEDLFEPDGVAAPGLTCRVYETPLGLSGAPSVEQLVAALGNRS